MKPSRTDAIGPLLVFLDLLKRHVEFLGKSRLRHALFKPPQADFPADLDIERADMASSHM
jgi:hypothetical protein